MDELDCLLSLSERPGLKEAREYFLKEKRASFKEDALKYLLANAPSKAALIGGALTAAVATPAAYMLLRPNPKTGKSIDQRLTDATLKALEQREQALAEEGKEPSLRHGIQKSIAVGSEELNKHFARHPKKAALLVGAATAPIGARLGEYVLKKALPELL
jgi:hypothetical protein